MSRQGRILVVDDNEANRDALSRLLARQGFLVEVAAGGHDALRLAAGRAFDMVLLDIEMPGISGLDVLRALRETRSPIQLPVIMVTARTRGADVVEAFHLGANDYVTKPIDFPVALSRVQTHLAHKWAVEDLRASEERYALAARGANDGLWDWNLVSNEVYWSPRWKSMLGCGDAEVGSDPDEWLSRIHHADVEAVKAALSAYLAGSGTLFEQEHRIRHRNGLFRWVLCRGAAVRDEAGVVTRLAGSLTDVTDARVADALTGLPNQLLLEDLLDRAIGHARRHPDEGFAVLLLGLGGVPTVNHGLGPVTADRLLVAAGERLQASLTAAAVPASSGVRVTLARLTGDEFAVLLEHVTDAQEPLRVAERLQAALRAPFDIDGHRVFSSVAVGITVSATGYRRPSDVMQDAAIALHRAKADEATPIEHFDPTMRERAVSRLRLESDLRQAVERAEFEVYYQPIIAVATGRISAFEALARWRHPVRGLVGPGEFIAAAEETGVIRCLGHQLLVESCRRMADWVGRFPATAPVLMSVNLSARQLAQPELASQIETVLRDSGLAPEHLKLEITESAFIADVTTAEATLNRLRTLGVGWSLDDFGTGYSSLSYLHRLQADTLKIDRSFVRRLGASHGSEMVRAIVTLAHSLGMDVVAEGVETGDQLVELSAMGCEYVQGFYFSQPVDLATAETLIAAAPWQAASITSLRQESTSANPAAHDQHVELAAGLRVA